HVRAIPARLFVCRRQGRDGRSRPGNEVVRPRRGERRAARAKPPGLDAVGRQGRAAGRGAGAYVEQPRRFATLRRRRRARRQSARFHRVETLTGPTRAGARTRLQLAAQEINTKPVVTTEAQRTLRKIADERLLWRASRQRR